MSLGTKLQATFDEIQRKKDEAAAAEAARIKAKRDKDREDRIALIEIIKDAIIFQIECGNVPEIRVGGKSHPHWLQTLQYDKDLWDHLEVWALSEGLSLKIDVASLDRFDEYPPVTIYVKPKKVVDLTTESV